MSYSNATGAVGENKRVLFVWANRYFFGFKPISISLLSSIVKQRGYETSLYDTSEIDFGFDVGRKSQVEFKIFKKVDLEKYGVVKKAIDLEESFLQHYDMFKPKYLAFSVLNDERFNANKIASIAKRHDQKVIIIWGGKYPTINPERVLRHYPVDYVCVGEGLEAFPELLETLEDGGDPSKVANIWGWGNGQIFKNNVRPLKKDLDSLPFLDWDIFDKRHFYKAYDGNVMISGDYMVNWGCPYHCTYCINHFNHELYNNNYHMRRFSTERVIDELVYLKNRYGLNFMKYHDEDFLMRGTEGFREFSLEYKKRVNLPFTIETNPKSVSREKADLLKNMNCASASLAIESGDGNFRRNVLNRVDSREDIINAFALLKENKIRSTSFNLLGFPFETRDTYEATVAINREAEVQYPNMNYFFPYEGTVLRDVSVKEGFFTPPADEEEDYYRNDRPTLKYEYLSESQIINMRKVFVLRVKFPEIFKKFIIRAESDDELGQKLFSELSSIYDKTVFDNNGWYNDNGMEKDYLLRLEGIWPEGKQ